MDTRGIPGHPDVGAGGGTGRISKGSPPFDDAAWTVTTLLSNDLLAIDEMRRTLDRVEQHIRGMLDYQRSHK